MTTHLGGLRTALLLDLGTGLVVLALLLGATAVFDLDLSTGFSLLLAAGITAYSMVTNVLQHRKRQTHAQ